MLSKLTGFISDQQEFPLLLAELDAGTLFYIVVGLLAAISHWITKRKEAAKQAEFLESAEDHDFEVRWRVPGILRRQLARQTRKYGRRGAGACRKKHKDGSATYHCGTD